MDAEFEKRRVDPNQMTGSGMSRRALIGRGAVASVGVAGLSGLLAACGGASGDSEAAAAATAGGGGGKEAGGSIAEWGIDPSKVGKKTIGVIQVLGSSQGSVRIVSGAKATAPAWDIQEFDAVGDAAKAANAWDNFLQAGVDGMVYIGFPYEAFASKVQAAAKANVPVIACSSNYGPGVSCACGTSGIAGGANMGLIVADNLNYQGSYAVVNNPTTALVQLQRQLGFESAVNSYKGFKKVSESELNFANPQEDGAKQMESLLQKYPKGKLDAVFFGWDLPAVPAAEVAHSQGRDEIWVVGTDGDTEAFERIRRGYNFATTAPNYDALGGLAVKELAKIMSSGKPDGRAIYIEEPGVYTGNILAEADMVFPPRPVTYTKGLS